MSPWLWLKRSCHQEPSRHRKEVVARRDPKATQENREETETTEGQEREDRREEEDSRGSREMREK